MIRVESPRDQINVAKVYEAGQEQVFAYWDELGPDERVKLLRQIEAVDFGEFSKLVRQHLTAADEPSTSFGDLRAADWIGLERTAEMREAARRSGLEALKAGRVAAFLVAGGQGTRLRFDGPKGMFPIGPVTERTLFQHHAEKLRTRQREVKRSIPWIIMTSESNHDETVAFLDEHSHFGLNASDVIVKAQGMLPVVDSRRGKILMRSKHEMAMSPNGHGGAIAVMQGLYETLARRGVEYLFTFQVDNPLVVMVDPEFIGHHIQTESQFSSKATAKTDPQEKVGVFCRSGDQSMVVEYSELGEAEREARDEDGRLTFRAGNIAQHVISLDYIAPDNQDFEMIYHTAHKATEFLRDGETVEADEPNSVRFESFIFDAMRMTKQATVVEVDREEEFAPVKNLAGVDSAETCRTLMQEQWARWLAAAGYSVPRGESGQISTTIEISPIVATNAAELAEALRGRSLDFSQPIVLEETS